MRLKSLLVASASLLAFSGLASAQVDAQRSLAHGNLAYSLASFFVLAGLSVYLVFKGTQTR